MYMRRQLGYRYHVVHQDYVESLVIQVTLTWNVASLGRSAGMSDTTILERARAGKEPPESASGPGRNDPPDPSGGGGGLVRVTVNLTPAAAQAMERLCDETGYSKTDVINRALQVYEVWQEI